MRKLHRVRDVLLQARSALVPPPAVRVRVEDAVGRYSAESVLSSLKLPPSPKSVVDGYAMRAEDSEAAGPSSPVVLRLRRGLLRPGGEHGEALKPGEAVRVETGALLPDGADAVLPVEDAEERGDRIFVYRKVAKFENVSLPGEEYDEGVPIVEKGSRISPFAVGALILEGRESVLTYDLRARILNIGDELVKGTYFKPFTQYIIAAWLRQHGISVEEISVAGDDEEEVKDWLLSREAYFTLLVGGTSMGGHDVTVKALESLKPEFLVHGFAVQPGKTACLAVLKGRPVLALSGLPVAAMSTLELVFKPLLRELGLRPPEYPRVRARLTRRLTVKTGVLGFARVRVYEEGGELYAEPVMVGGSGALVSLLRSNGFVVVPEDVEGFDEGEVVEVQIYGEVGGIARA